MVPKCVSQFNFHLLMNRRHNGERIFCVPVCKKNCLQFARIDIWYRMSTQITSSSHDLIQRFMSVPGVDSTKRTDSLSFYSMRSLDVCNLRQFLHWNFLGWSVMHDRRSLFDIKFAFDSRRNGLIWFALARMYHIDNRCYAEMLWRLFNMKCIIVILNARQLQTTHILRTTTPTGGRYTSIVRV